MMKLGEQYRIKLLLAGIPLIYLFFGILFSSKTPEVHFSTPDPQYAYLFNGTNLASGFFEVGLIEHPGTPVQIFAAIVIFIKHLFSSGLIYEDVLQHPESYLRAINTTLLFFLPLITFLTGLYVYKKGGNVALAIIFQLVPLCRGAAEQAVRLEPESLMVIAGMFYMAFIYFALIKPAEAGQKAGMRNTIISAVFTGFLIACKFTCIPLILIPLFILGNFKERLAYLSSSICSFFLFILPAYTQWNHMSSWFTSLIFHDGRYGMGQQRILDPMAFKNALITMFFGVEVVFPVVFVLITISLFIALRLYVRKEKSNAIYLRSLLGIWIAICVTIIAVAKHYAFYYLQPAQICFPLALVVSDRILMQTGWYRKVRKLTIILIPVSLSIAAFPDHIDNLKPERESTAESRTQAYMEKWKNVPVIIANRGDAEPSAFVEPSLVFGSVYSGHQMMVKYLGYLDNIYPHSYEYNIERDALSRWGNEEVSAQIFEKSSKALIYFIRETAEKEAEVLSKLKLPAKGEAPLHYQKIYSEPVSHEDIFEIKADSVFAHKLMSRYKTISSPAGANPVVLNKDNPFGFTLKFPVTPGSFITATVWNKGVPGYIVFSSEQNSLYRGGAMAAEQKGDGWKKLSYSCHVPNDFKGDSLTAYVLYDGKADSQYKDFSLTIYPVQISDSAFVRK